MLNSCSHSIYAPNNKSTHTVSQKGQLFVSGSATYVNDLNIGFNGFLNYSPKENVALQAHYNIHRDLRNFGFGLGLYKSKYRPSWENTKKGFHYDLYLESTYNVYTFLNRNYTHIANLYYYNISLPIGIHFQNEVLGFDLVARPHFFDFFKAEIKDQFSTKEEEVFNDYIKKPYLSSDLLARMNLGKDHFKVFCTVGVSYANRTTLYFVDPYSVTAGFNLNIGKYIKL